MKVVPATQPTLTKTSLLPNYGANIPAAHQQLPELLEQATTTSETPNAMQGTVHYATPSFTMHGSS